MVTTLSVGILLYLIPLAILVVICMCCTVVRERRRARITNINQHHIPTPRTIVNLVEQSSRENNSPPPPYTAQPSLNFDDSLPSYERAINRPL